LKDQRNIRRKQNAKDRTLKKRIKRTFSLHHWIGLVAGIFLLISSITGSVLVFHHEIDHAQFSAETTLEKPANELIIDNSFERIRKLYPDYDIRIPDLPDDPNQALKYELRKGQTRKWIFSHPETGAFLAEVKRADQRLVHVLLELHYMLLSGTVGKIVVLLLGIALIVLSITGFMLYRKSILKVLTFKQRISLKSRRSLFSSLHRIIGVWSLVFNLFISVTGTYIAFTIVQGAFSSGGGGKIESPPVFISLDATLNKVKRAYPSFDTNYLLFPKNADGKLTILGRLESDPAFYGFNYSNIQVNTKTGEIASTSFLRNLPWYKRAITIFKPLHFGDYGGLSIKLIYCFFGIFPGVLAISGFFIWRLRPAKRSHPPP
jgi:uncharacterized iron-regulated membrane protein